jgi:hypothetical protein
VTFRTCLAHGQADCRNDLQPSGAEGPSIGALEHFWCPLRAEDELLPYLEGTWGEPVTVEALAGLLAAERQAFDQAMARPVWICGCTALR